MKTIEAVVDNAHFSAMVVDTHTLHTLLFTLQNTRQQYVALRTAPKPPLPTTPAPPCPDNPQNDEERRQEGEIETRNDPPKKIRNKSIKVSEGNPKNVGEDEC